MTYKTYDANALTLEVVIMKGKTFINIVACLVRGRESRHVGA